VAVKKFRVVVIVSGQGEDHRINGPLGTEGEAQEQLRLVTKAQERGGDALLTLPWLSVAEKNIRAAFIEHRWTGTTESGFRR
jgi:hypothetical protein